MVALRKPWKTDEWIWICGEAKKRKKKKLMEYEDRPRPWACKVCQRLRGIASRGTCLVMDSNFSLPTNNITTQWNTKKFHYILRGKILSLRTRSIFVLFLLYIADLGAIFFLVYIYLGCYGTFKKIIYLSRCECKIRSCDRGSCFYQILESW